MSLSQTVTHLAERLRPLAGEKYKYIADLLITMPHWVEVRDMTEWEERCGEALCRDVPKEIDWCDIEYYDVNLYLLMRVYELGRCNLYGAYKEEYTRQEYDQVITAFRNYNVPGERPSSEEDLSSW